MAGQLRKCKKPKSAIHCDIPPAFVSDFSDLLAIPLTPIYNAVFKRKQWPKIWKREAVTVIPKRTDAAYFSDLRNLSCTPLFSKVLEHFILERLQSEVHSENNQYGGVKGRGTNAYLMDAWNYILEALDCEKGPAVNLITLDFVKAFNMMAHQPCLDAFQKHGASHESLELMYAFLSN